ncbi:hypothetical protein YB2330_002314 [Saitoella coloradoensis]
MAPIAELVMATFNNTRPVNGLPPTHNPGLISNPMALYNETLLLTALGLFQHSIIFGLVFLFRGFDPKKVCDLRWLVTVFAATFVGAPAVFLFDRHLDMIKQYFFLEHEAVEYLLFGVVCLPNLVHGREGWVLGAGWAGVCAITLYAAFDDFHWHSTDVIAWNAFISDSLVGIAGVVLALRAWRGLKNGGVQMPATVERLWAEVFAGMGMACHGFTTLPVPPVFTAIVYFDLDPKWFAYAWAFVFAALLATMGLSAPMIKLFIRDCWYGRADEINENGDEDYGYSETD